MATTKRFFDKPMDLTVDRDSPEPLPSQAARVLRGQIERGELAGKLPAEPDLAATLDISRDTLRAAIRMLTDEGLVTVVRGRGTFVVRRHDDRD